MRRCSKLHVCELCDEGCKRTPSGGRSTNGMHLRVPRASPLIRLWDVAQQVATMFAAMKDTDYGKNPAFQKNFMEAWRPLLKQTAEGKIVKDLAKCDFSIIAAHLDEEKEKKKNMSKEEKVGE
mgnify:CR=1 FL=1